MDNTGTPARISSKTAEYVQRIGGFLREPAVFLVKNFERIEHGLRNSVKHYIIYSADGVKENFPNATFVFVIRDPWDNIRSLLNRLRLYGGVQVEPSSFEGANPTWLRVREGCTPDVPGSNYVERIVERWTLASRLFLDRADWMIPVKCETCKEAKEETVSATLRNLGFSHLKPIDHLVDRQFQPKGDHGVSWEEFFGPKGLETIEAVCGAEMRQLAYPPLLIQE